MEKETNKPTKIFIWLSIIFSLLFATILIIAFSNDYSFPLYPLIILMSIFAFYSMIMSIFIFSKKLREFYSFSIFSIIINVLAIFFYVSISIDPVYLGEIYIGKSSQILLIASYFALFFISLYNFWKN